MLWQIWSCCTNSIEPRRVDLSNSKTVCRGTMAMLLWTNSAARSRDRVCCWLAICITLRINNSHKGETFSINTLKSMRYRLTYICTKIFSLSIQFITLSKTRVDNTNAAINLGIEKHRNYNKFKRLNLSELQIGFG